jgi:hypothetical protein
MAKTDVKGRYYERLRTFDTPVEPPFPPKVNKVFFAFFDSFDVAESEVKIDHTIAIVARLVPLLNDNGITELFAFGQASHTGAHAFNKKLAEDRRDRLTLEVLQNGFGGASEIALITPMPSDNVFDLHENLPVGEHKRFRRVVLMCDGTNIDDSAVDNLFPDPPDLQTEAD